MTISSSTSNLPTLDGRTLYNAPNATTIFNGTSPGFELLFAHAAAFYNQGTFLDQTTHSTGFFFDGSFYNQGTYTKTGNSQTEFRLSAFNNSGTVNAQAGTLLVSGGSSSGSFTAASGFPSHGRWWRALSVWLFRGRQKAASCCKTTKGRESFLKKDSRPLCSVSDPFLIP
jgi:hypothetical protein